MTEAHARQKNVLEAADFFLVVRALIEGRRAAFKRRCTFAFMVIDAGPFSIDTESKQIVTAEWRPDAQVSILTNRRTLNDWVTGRFDPKRPSRGHLFLWGGDRGAWDAFSKALSGGKSALAVHLAALKR